MIIAALNQYYETLLEDENSGVSKPGFSKVGFSYALVISKQGELINIIDLCQSDGKRQTLLQLNVPEKVKRASGIASNFMWDNCKYALGLAQVQKDGKKDRTDDTFKAFAEKHNSILAGVDDEGVQSLLTFLDKWDVTNAAAHPLVQREIEGLQKGGNIVFRLEGSSGYLHERAAIQEAWFDYNTTQAGEVTGQCLINGKIGAIPHIHPSIQGVTGAKSIGAALVSFNIDAATSYGKSQNFNAPISKDVAFAYTTSLNYLLKSMKHRIRIGDTTTVFWAERITGGLEEDLLSALFFPSSNKDDETEGSERFKRDPQTVQLLKDVLHRVQTGQKINDEVISIDPEVKYYILGLAPNAARLSVRFWQVDSFGNFVERILQHYRDLAIAKNFDYEPDFIPISRILKETAPLGDSKRVSPLLGGALMRAILTGSAYPQLLYNSIISRIRADNIINYVRVAVIKGCIVRNQRLYKKEKGVNIYMSLDEQNTSIPYRLGRLFSLLEKAQQDANPGINATIKDRYFGSASATPGSVFPILIRLAQHHISKSDYGRLVDKRIEEVMAGIDRFPSHLNLEEQGFFVLGYYHQRQANYKKNESKEV